MKTKTFTQVFLLFLYKLLSSFLLSFTKIFSFSSKREERGVFGENIFAMETLSSIFNFFKKEVTSFLRNIFAVLQNFMGGNAIKFKQKASFNKVIARKGRVAIFAFLLVLGVVGNAWGQTTSSEINGGSTSYSNVDFAPLDPYYAFNYSQMIYTASELTSAGLTAGSTISGVLFYYAVDGGVENDFDDWVVRLGNTATSTFTSTTSWIATSGMTSVYNSAVTFPAANNWMTIDFSSNFIWDGTSNLVIAVDENSAGYENDVAPWRSTEQFVGATQQARVITFRADLTNPDPASPPTASGTNHWRPVIKLKYTNLCTATTYYSKSTGNLNLTSSWSSTTDGTGCSPANFTTAGVTYIIQQNLTLNATRTIGANWTVSGSGSKVIVGQASAAAVTFTVPNNYTYTGTIDVAAASSGSNTLVLYHTTVPTLGTLNIGSTVKFNASGIQTIPVNTYGNLETGVQSGSTNYTKTAAGILDINGNLTLGDYSTLALSSYSHTLAGDFIKPTGNGILNAGTSTLTFDGASTQKIHVTTAGGTTPCDADVTYNNLVINGTDVKLYYNQVTNRKMNIVDLTVNTSKVLTLFSAP